MSVEITTNTTLRLEPLINHENERLGLHNRDDIVLGKRIINVYVKKDDSYKIKLQDYKKENVCHRIRDQIIEKVL